jgi:hypothetical protein
MNAAGPLFPRVVALPPGCGLSPAAHDMLKALAWFADHGVEDPPQEWLALWVHKTERQARRLLQGLVSDGWIVADGGRTAEGRRRRTRYAMSGGVLAEKLNGCDAPWVEEIARRMAASGFGVVVGNVSARGVDNPPPPDTTGRNLPAMSGGPADTTGRNVPAMSGGAYRVHGSARARPSLYSFPLSFAWRDDAQRLAMERILAVCGVGLCDPVQCEGLTESLAEVLDDWLKRFDLDADIVPCIEKATRNPRPKPVYDFRLFDRPGDSDLQRWREARLVREQRKAERAARPKASNGGLAARPARQPDELDKWLARTSGHGNGGSDGGR